MTGVRRLHAVVMVAVVALGIAGPALSLSVSEVAREVRCPTCNTPLDVSNSPAAAAMKDFIAARIAKGEGEDQIINELVVEFGRGVLATPPKSGFDLIAWIVPALFVAAGLAAIPFVTRSWARRRATPEVADISPDDAARLEDELRSHSG